MPLSLQNSEGIKSFLASVIEDISLPQVKPCTAAFISGHGCLSIS